MCGSPFFVLGGGNESGLVQPGQTCLHANEANFDRLEAHLAAMV